VRFFPSSRDKLGTSPDHVGRKKARPGWFWSSMYSRNVHWKRQLILQRAGVYSRVAQNARGVVKGVVKGVTRASFGRRAPLTPRLKRASARRREEKVFRGVYMIQQVAAVHLGWGQAPSLDSNVSYESTVWVPLDLYCEYRGCYLGRREGVLAA